MTDTITIKYTGVRITERGQRELERDIIEPDLDRRATNMQLHMVRGAPKRTGRLVSTIRKNPGRTAIGPHVDVLVGRRGLTDYLGYILDGTPPHVIAAIANRPNAHLRFMVGGQIVYAKLVRHPGTAPNNFMLRALPEALR